MAPDSGSPPALAGSEAFESGLAVHFLPGGFHRSVAFYVRMKAPRKKCADGPLSKAARDKHEKGPHPGAFFVFVAEVAEIRASTKGGLCC